MSFTKINHYEKEYADTHHDTALNVTEGVEDQPIVSPYFTRRKKPKLSTDQYVEGILAGNITTLSQAITLIESNNPAHYAQAQEVIQAYGEAWPAEAWDAYVQAAVEAYLPVARAVVAEQDASQAQAAVPGLVADSQSAFLEALQQPTADQLVQLAMGLGNVRATIQALGEAQAQLDTAEQTARQQFDAAWNELNEGEAQIIFGKSQIADKRAELENGSMALSEGEAQLAQKEQETAAADKRTVRKISPKDGKSCLKVRRNTRTARQNMKKILRTSMRRLRRKSKRLRTLT